MAEIGDGAPLPQEDLLQLVGANRKRPVECGWPEGMMSQSTAKMLIDNGITRASQVFQLALCLSEDQFRNYFRVPEFAASDPAWEEVPNWGMLNRWLNTPPERLNHPLPTSPDFLPEYNRRCAEWTGLQCRINTSILTDHKDSDERLRAAALRFPRFGTQKLLIAESIRRNNERLANWEVASKGILR
jgi:hypothetical protein